MSGERGRRVGGGGERLKARQRGVSRGVEEASPQASRRHKKAERGDEVLKDRRQTEGRGQDTGGPRRYAGAVPAA